ncbi:MAG: hypothetical protein ACK5R0_15030, partial [Bacteroidota bacterium]
MSICVRAGLSKPRLVPDTERIKDTKTLDYASTPLDANTLCLLHNYFINILTEIIFVPCKDEKTSHQKS